ncbi:uncharacterized protein LOC122306917 [Carya illinoinensis]|uniref:uncharacterized protein LOC122306917 n=1 Tax=Carya illinoinensis TaxID=32201 RepID=UPI001C7234C6|nr:uncharacterized protein LOC122306917 [Carya illinoinensis]
MEGAATATKRVLVVMMLLLAIIVVEAQEVSPSYDPNIPKQEKFNFCHLKCGVSCLFKSKVTTIKFVICLALCLFRCRHPHQDPVVYDVLKSVLYPRPPCLNLKYPMMRWKVTWTPATRAAQTKLVPLDMDLKVSYSSINQYPCSSNVN